MSKAKKFTDDLFAALWTLRALHVRATVAYDEAPEDLKAAAGVVLSPLTNAVLTLDHERVKTALKKLEEAEED